MRSRQIALPLRLHARSDKARRATGDRNGSLLRERGNERRDRSVAREDAAARREGPGFRLARVKRKTTTKKTEACSRVGMRTKLKLGRVCRLVASWQA